jgi:hypothetical protein
MFSTAPDSPGGSDDRRYRDKTPQNPPSSTVQYRTSIVRYGTVPLDQESTFQVVVP